ncbi:MAG: type II toxin-antitoxin system VapC family toxin [Rhodospirillales bacterium]|nr:type II toxin-antitoxin system VapC family toxin [Rhodospirillales bacterium]
MFVDASAIVAILTREADADLLADRLDAATAPVTSPVALFEATLGLCRKRRIEVAEAETNVGEFLAAAGIRVVAITPADGAAALAAFARYGKGRGHPAQLNLGDCFAYAGAKTRRVGLLHTGQDFAQTDLAVP